LALQFQPGGQVRPAVSFRIACLWRGFDLLRYRAWSSRTSRLV